MSEAAEETIIKLREAKAVEKEEIARLLALPSGQAKGLLEEADAARKRSVGDGILLRGIIEFSNYCLRDCLYCGLRRSNRRLGRYRMEDDEVIAAAHRIKEAGVGTVVLQSGEDPFYSAERLAILVETIRRETGLLVTLSVGERSAQEYERWHKAGARRFLLKFETSNQGLFGRLRPGCRLQDRLSCLRHLAAAGYEVGTGNIVGLPGQTLGMLAEDLILIKELNPKMVGIGPLLPHPDTPLAKASSGDIELTLKALAVTRLLLPEANIPATTALATLSQAGRLLALKAGANVVMPDFTPPSYRQLYDLYPGRSRSREAADLIAELEESLAREGRFLAEEDPESGNIRGKRQEATQKWGTS